MSKDTLEQALLRGGKSRGKGGPARERFIEAAEVLPELKRSGERVGDEVTAD